MRLFGPAKESSRPKERGLAFGVRQSVHGEGEKERTRWTKTYRRSSRSCKDGASRNCKHGFAKSLGFARYPRIGPTCCGAWLGGYKQSATVRPATGCSGAPFP